MSVGIWFKHKLPYSLFTVIIRLIAAVFNFPINIVAWCGRNFRLKTSEKHQQLNNHGQNIGNKRKCNKISVNLNIWKLVPRDFSIFLILRDSTKNGNGNSVLPLNSKKEGCCGSKIRKFEGSF